ncbi:glycoside hydrolase family 97 protein [Algibacter mikhailovii]|uniref:glycoside hydrolase family 97 protein n=1 Tax=Algibacter mikhailovii TaxID=425498 RepID=UPI0024947424|nr:glycoside hydrolase family 97 protein [Algibacter mikhailovii]
MKKENFKKMKNGLFSICLILIAYNCSATIELDITSPDEKVLVQLDNFNGRLAYSVLKNNVRIISNSEITLFQGKAVKILDSNLKHVDEIWSPVWGQFSEIKNDFQELEVTLDYQGAFATLYIRVYNGGVAFQFKADGVTETTKPSFFMEYDLSRSSELYSPAGEGQPMGPVRIDELALLDAKKNRLKMPLVVETDTNMFVSLLESDLISSEGFKLISFRFDKGRNKLVSTNEYNSSNNDIVTPWKLILIEDQIGDLLINTIPLNVASPNQINDVSWIKPGKTLWDWRVHGYTTKDGFTYGIDNESYYRFIDFAAENGIEYFLIDDAWYSAVEPGKITLSEKLDLDKVIAYAKEKEVSLLLYYDRRQGNYGDQALFPYYNSLGMKGIKYGFMGSNVSFTRDAIVMSAESDLLIDFHDGPVPFTGVSRTYPNAITREFCHAQQDSRRAFTTKTFIRMALINAIQGPLDMNNGIFGIKSVNNGERLKGPRKLNSLYTTVVSEVARTLIVFSGLVCIPDAPEAYASKQDLFDFIKKMPVGKWDETKIIKAKMDSYITIARRSREEWFVGSVHGPGGTLEIPLDFLEADKNYRVTYYEDRKETKSIVNPEAYQIRTEIVTKDVIVRANMVADGGHCMWIRPE